MIFEFLWQSFLMGFGVVVLRFVGLRGRKVVPLGYLTGAAVYVVVAFVQIGLALPSTPALTLGVLAAGVVAMIALDRGGVREIAAPIACGVAGLALIVPICFKANLVKFHYDSIRYLAVSGLIARNHVGSISPNLLEARLSAVSVLHAPAQLWGETYMRSLAPVVSVCLLFALAWLVAAAGRQLGYDARMLYPAAAAGLLLTNRMYVWHSAYLNGHLIFAAFLLVGAGAAFLLPISPPGQRRALAVLAAVALSGLVLTREEGPLFACAAVLPVALDGKTDRPSRLTVLIGVAATLSLKAEVVAVGLRRLHAHLGHAVVGQIALLVVGVLALVLVGELATASLRRPLLWGSEAALWLVLMGLTATHRGVLRRSVVATWHNAVAGDGRWGASLVVTALLVAVAVCFRGLPATAGLRFAVTTFVPIAFVSAIARGEPYRVGVTDSLNRMWIQILPLAVLYVVISAATALEAHRS